MQPEKISCLSDYIRSIGRLRRDYLSDPFNNSASSLFLFRGHSDEAYNLLPNLFRKVGENVTGQNIQNSKYLSLGTEKGILQNFIQEASCYIDIPSTELARWAEYAQHYGAPTRFLDWTSNPLVALYFACTNHIDRDGMVWLLHPANYSRQHDASVEKTRRDVVKELIDGNSDVSYPFLYTPYYVDARMSAQSSWFMAWGTEEAPLESLVDLEKAYMSYDSSSEKVRRWGGEQITQFLYQFCICADRKQSLLRELDAAGINEKTLFPGLDGVGRYIERKYRLDNLEFVTSR